MRQIAISVLSLMIVLPAFADVRLPVVNLAAGGVSARAAFGEPIVKSNNTESATTVAVNTNNSTDIKKSESGTEQNTETVARSVVQRSVQPAAKNIDTGGQIIASGDVLIPRRPSTDLWARSDAPLRLPRADEFSVIRSDDLLPEESLDTAIASRSAPVQPARTVQTETVVESTPVATAQPLSEIDAQIARLNELQRLADESVAETASVVAAAPVEKQNTRAVVARPSVATGSGRTLAAAPQSIESNANSADDVKLSRVVVPMTDDVIVRAVERAESPRIISTRNDMTQMSPSELRKAFRKTFLSENKHLSTFQIDDRFDVASDMTSNAAGFTSARDLSEAGGIRPLEIKIKFRNDDSALSRDNYNLLTEYASIVLSNPTRAVQVSIPESATRNTDDRKLAARRLAIVEQVLRDNGISEQRILPVLSQRSDEGLVLRMISLDQYETLTQQQRDMFGDTVSKKTYRSMSW